MVDRQDIDALLISALYGELTPADEARLSTHLESHPADKSVLADLTRTRATVLESRFLTVQLEPPQAVSAMLLQEATSRRPAKAVATEPVAKEGWFSRFVGSFARHPAMAAAAMLVVVLGFAGTMYMRGGAQDASKNQTTKTFGGEQAPAGAPAPAPAIAAEVKQLERAAGSAYEAQLAEQDGVADEYRGADKAGKLENAKKDEAKKDTSVADAPRRDAPKVPPRTYITTESVKNEPMDLDAAPRKPDTGVASIPDKSRAGRTPNNVVVVEGRAPAADPIAPGAVQPRPPTAPAPRPQTASKGAGGAVGGDNSDRGEAEKNVDPDAQWAKDQHVRVSNAVKANNCKDASSLAVALSNRAPGYYQQNVENDIALKKCMTYINAARDQEADRQQRARALQKRNADEAKRTAPPPAADKSK